MSDGFCDDPDMRGFIPFSAKRFGSKIRGIGLDHEASCRSLDDGLADFMGGLEGGDTAEGNKAAGIEDTFCIFPWTDEAMEHCTDRSGVFMVNCERILKRRVALAVPSVDHDVELRGGSEFEVLAEQVALSPAELVFFPSLGCGVIVIQSGLADGTDARVMNEVSESGGRVIWRVMHIAGMDADARVDGGIFREGEIGLKIFERCGE